MKLNFLVKDPKGNKEIIKNIIFCLLGIFLFSVSWVILIYIFISKINDDFIYTTYGNMPKTEAAIILGAKVYEDGRLSDMLIDRSDVAIELYNNEKVGKILVTGDHGTRGYDEVNAIKKYLLDNQVPAEDIFLDHAGFDTYDSLYRAKSIFMLKSATVVTQNFHLPRAMYIGRGVGLTAYGISADKHSYGDVTYNYIREVPADMKAFMNVVLRVKPKFLGEQISISGDGQKSWD